MPLSNNYSLRTAKDQRPCFICGKFASSVLDAPDDFFFICLSHCSDSGFCTVTTTIIKSEAHEDSEIDKLKMEISELKGQINKTDSKETDKQDTKIGSRAVCANIKYKQNRKSCNSSRKPTCRCSQDKTCLITVRNRIACSTAVCIESVGPTVKFLEDYIP